MITSDSIFQDDVLRSVNTINHYISKLKKYNIMRNLKIVFALVIATIFMLTSCQKEAIEDITPNSTTEKRFNSLPLEDQVKDYSNELLAKMNTEEPEVTYTLPTAQSRNGGVEEIQILSPEKAKIELRCGDVTIGSNNHDFNSFNDNFYARQGFNSNHNGGDDVYFFDAPSDMEVTFSLRTFSGQRRNLAMFLFEGDYNAKDHVAFIDKVIKASSSRSTFSESLTQVAVKGGKRYILVIDSNPNNGADYELSVICHQNDDCDDFQSYQRGNISPQNPAKWEKWDNKSQDGQIEMLLGHNNVLSIERNPFGNAQPDVLFKTGKLTRGEHTLTMDMFVSRGNSGYINIQKRLRQSQGAGIYFLNNGRGVVKIAGRNLNFNYSQDKWMSIELKFDLDLNEIIFRIDGRLMEVWPASADIHSSRGDIQIEGIDFYPALGDTNYLIDNVCFE